MVVFGKIGYILAKWLYSVKVVVFWKKRLYLDKVVIFVQSGCIRAKTVVLGQKWL